MAGKRGVKRKEPKAAGKRSSPRNSKGKTDDVVSDLSDDEHCRLLVGRDREHAKKKPSTKNSTLSPSIQSDHVEFPLSNLTAHLTCELCGGYYRDCHTIVDCLHSFCRSCLTLFFEKKRLVGNKHCPTCDIELGPHPFRRHTSISTVQILPDRTLQEVVDKMLPRFKVNEAEDEKKFYARKNINLKAEYQQVEDSDASDRKVQDLSLKSPLVNGGVNVVAAAAAAFMNDNSVIELILQPDISNPSKRLPALKNANLRTSGKLKIISLKKYILQKLDSKEDKSIDILCNGHPMGNEFNLTFIYRTMWLFTKPNDVLTLTYSTGG